MISVSGKQWEERKISKNLVEKLKQDYKFSEIISKLIISRNFDNAEISSIENKPHLINIFKNNSDFNQSINLLCESINKKENICILGDYDVDGSVATSLLVNFFQHIKQPFFYYIPDRVKDGYGASKVLFEKLIKKKPKLIIMVDCGSTSIEAVDFLNKNKIKSIIIDHHEINKPYPKANIIINPKKDNGYIEYNYLCASALVYFFIDLLIKKIEPSFDIKKYLIHVLLATVCDVMPLRKLNRFISMSALENFDINENEVFYELYKLSNKNNKINIGDLGFLIGPILNSGGRLGKSSYATELLTSTKYDVIKKRAAELFFLNQKRREIETTIINEVDFKKIEKENKDIIIYYNPIINEGLIGIIAARLNDYFNKPAIVITNSNDNLKGSARSIIDFNIGQVIKKALDEKIIISGGGHNMAAGFTLDKDKLKTFENFIYKDYSTKSASIKNNFFTYDSEISSLALNQIFFDDIKIIGPFGTGNPLPTFLIKDLKIIQNNIIKDKHISTILKSKTGFSIKSICFNSINTKIGEYLLGYKKNLNFVGQINENFWNNKNSLQLTIKDLIL